MQKKSWEHVESSTSFLLILRIALGLDCLTGVRKGSPTERDAEREPRKEVWKESLE